MTHGMWVGSKKGKLLTQACKLPPDKWTVSEASRAAWGRQFPSTTQVRKGPKSAQKPLWGVGRGGGVVRLKAQLDRPLLIETPLEIPRGLLCKDC